MSEDEFDMLDLTAIQPSVNREDSEDDGFDDNDLDQLVEVTETVEQQRGQITFVSFGEHDPDPPPALPASTPSFHPFDPENLRTWIYPTNYTIRGYQFNIVQKAIFNNTLVALPTGLGKTFIAAVVMFNYYRWFPHSKIIFMAPTRPLVEQQIEACYTVCGLPQEDTVDMMGNTTPAKRKELWKSKRVFFATPQTVQKDLETAICPADKISCIVVDEAHKATGNFAYTAVVRRISKMNKHFRVLALTATPGSSLDAVQEVVNNLHITQIQIRTEDSMDIREFSHGKNIQHIVVKLSYTEGSTGLLPRVIQDYRSKVFGPLLLELSKKPTTVSADVDRASSFGLRSARLSFQLNAKNVPNTLKFQVISLFLVAEHAARAYELLCQHGIVPFVESMDSVLDEFNRTQQTGKKLNKSQRAFLDNRILQAILRNAKVEMVKPDFIGHPKMDQLVSILIQHFANLPEGASSKVMIFSSYRTSVQDICQVLNRHSPMLRPSFFVGQASDKNGVKGLKQSEQQEVIQKFKLDVFNILVSTSIGEEGLDIGEVDLIICFDSQSSPIRMLQRMGRTGRKRKGKCILLMTESEEKKFQQAKDAYAKIQGLIARGGLIRYYPENPAILPRHYKPTLCRKKLEVGQFKRKVVKRKRKLNEGDSIEFSSGLLKPEVKQAFVRSFSTPDHSYSSTEDLFDRLWPVQRMIKSVNRFMPLQTRLSACKVGHGQRSNQLVRLVQKMEHRILNPDDINLTHLTRPKQQEKLYLPSKGKAKQTTLFQHLIKHNSSKSILNRSKRVDDDDFADFMASHDMAQLIDTEAIFSASEEVKRQEEQEIVRKVHVSPSDVPQILSDLSPTISTSCMSQPVVHELSLKDDESDDFFDDLDDDLLLAHTDLVNPIGFDDPLLPEYPFESDIKEKTPIQFSWTSAQIPPFTPKAKALLEKRQLTMKAMVGHFLSIRESRPIKRDKEVVREAEEEPEEIIEEAKEDEPKEDEPKEDAPKEDAPKEDDDDLDPFDFMSDGVFANFFENKLAEDDPLDGLSQLLLEENISQSTQFMARKSSLYAPSKPKNQEEEEVMIFDLNEPISDSSDHVIPIQSPTPIVLISDDEVIVSPKAKSNQLLNELAKGYTPSPLKSESDHSPLFKRRIKKKRRLEEEEEEEEEERAVWPERKKRLKQRSSPHQKRPVYHANNPFFDMEAEKSSDEGHTSEEEEEGESLLDSFINDHSDILNSTPDRQAMYTHSLLDDQFQYRNGKHWMNRFDANKWLQEDNAMEEEEEEEEEEEPESIQEFSSDQNHMDDDFM